MMRSLTNNSQTDEASSKGGGFCSQLHAAQQTNLKKLMHSIFSPSLQLGRFSNPPHHHLHRRRQVKLEIAVAASVVAMKQENETENVNLYFFSCFIKFFFERRSEQTFQNMHFPIRNHQK